MVTAPVAESTGVDLSPIREMCARFDWVWDSLCEELKHDLQLST